MAEYTLSKMSEVRLDINHQIIDSHLDQNDSHIHNECEIYINLGGEVSFEVENRIYPISRGSVIITRPYEYHHCIYHSEKQHELYWITFSAEENEEYLKMFFDREKGKDNLIILEEDKLNELSFVINGILDKDTNPLKRRIGFLQMLSILSEGRRENYVGNMENLPQDIAKAIKYMDSHLLEEIDVKTLSKISNVSVNTLERHFKETLNMTPFMMLRKKRLIASMDYLRKGDSVSFAALKSGFSDYSNYIQLFRKQFGITPLQYKKNFEGK